jgi:hypothetical protein
MGLQGWCGRRNRPWNRQPGKKQARVEARAHRDEEKMEPHGDDTAYEASHMREGWTFLCVWRSASSRVDVGAGDPTSTRAIWTWHVKSCV